MPDRRTERISRRETLVTSGVGLAMVAGLRLHAGLARQPAVPEVVQAFLDGWRTMDPDRITQTFSAEGRREDITTTVVFEGREQIHQSLIEFFAAFEHATVEHPDVLAGPPQYAADTWIFTGDYVGALPGLPAGDGQSLTIRGFTLIDIADGEIQRTVDYYDALGLLAQLGVQPAFAPATPAAVSIQT